ADDPGARQAHSCPVAVLRSGTGRRCSRTARRHERTGAMTAPVTTTTPTDAPVVAGFGEMLTRNMRQSGILIAFVVVFAAAAIASPNFLSPGNITNIVLQYSYIL